MENGHVRLLLIISSNTNKKKIEFFVAILSQTNEGVLASNLGPKFEIFTPKKRDFRDISHNLAQPDHVQTIAYILLYTASLFAIASDGFQNLENNF